MKEARAELARRPWRRPRAELDVRPSSMASDAYTGALETRGVGGTLLIIKGQFGNIEGGHQMELGVLCFFSGS
jgi:hypothetical protein